MSENPIRTTIRLKGMATLGCGLAEKALLGLEGVSSAKASYASSAVAAEYDSTKVSLADLANALKKAGYTLEQPGKMPGTATEKVSQAKAVVVVKQEKNSATDNSASITLKVKGMSCSGCEGKIERILQKQAGVKSARANFSNNTVAIAYDTGAIGVDAMAAALAKAGYKLETKSSATKAGQSKDKKKFNINQVIGIGIILFAAYFIINKTVGFNFIPQVNQSMGYGLLFLVGLLTSIHCVAMCGGINMSQCISNAAGTTGTAAKVRPSLLYNTGRVISYTIIGGIVGAIGSVVSFSGAARGIVAVLSGLFMVVMGLSMLGIFPWLNKITPRMPKFLRSKAGAAKKGKGPFIVGLFNGLMPCGPLQAMQLYALGTGSFFAGALSMFIFSLGTVPLMFGLGALSTLLSSKFTSRMMKVSAALVLLLGLVMVNRGFALSGVNLLPSGQAQAAASSTVAGGVQNITSKLTSSGYPVITVQAGIPVKWDLQADAAVLNGCNGTLLIQKFNIEKKLQAGDNIIEFTPTETGTIPYSCWMGMITSHINVVAAGTSTASSVSAPASNATSGSAVSGGCCAGSGTATAFAGGKIPLDNIEVAKVVNGVQEVTITVNNQGYSPAVAVVQKGLPTKVKFVAEKLSSCNSTVNFPDYNGGIDLSAGQLETPVLTPTQDFTFQCGMGMLHGYVKVVTDITKINLDDIKKQVAAWKPAAGSGGCCG